MIYIFTNIGPGNGPYIRTIEMGIELIRLLKDELDEDLYILVPWVYGERQRRIIIEEFGDLLKSKPDLILLDKYLGQQFKKVLFDGRDYNTVMLDLIKSYYGVEKKIHNYLKKKIVPETINGKKVEVKGDNIFLEVSRNPCVATNIKFSYYTSIGYFEKIIRESLKNPGLNLNNKLLGKILLIAREIESYQHLFFQPEPNCFSYEEKYKPFKNNEIKCPPLFHPPKKNEKDIEEGFYVLVSGIPHLEKIYRFANRINMKMYSSQNIKSLINTQKERPIIIPNENIKFVLARTAWNTIWLSNLANKPLICLDYLKGDSPEIYFNTLSVRKRKLGVIYNEDIDFNALFERSKSLMPETTLYYDKIKEKYGTLDGIEYSCKIIADDFLSRYC